jgi:pilus assembly protein CpaF
MDSVDQHKLTMEIAQHLQARLGMAVLRLPPREAHKAIQEHFNAILGERALALSEAERASLLERATAEAIGYGPLEPLLQDPTITEVMVNGPKQVYIERGGVIEETGVSFDDDDHVLRIIDHIITPLGRRCDHDWPMIDARLPDGSRVNAIIPPLALNGPTITIRKFARVPLTMEDLISFGTLSEEVAEFLQACVAGRISAVISGGTGSGKTTLLNVVSSFIPERERIITIEDTAELQLHQRHWVRLEGRPPDLDGKGAVTIRHLVINALRMRPNRIVVGEVRGPEALDMLQAMNTGHDGSLTTCHSNSPRDTLYRLETMVLMAGVDLPIRVIREQISRAIDLIVHCERLDDGSRKVTHVTEVQGMEGEVITTQDIFVYEQTSTIKGTPAGKLRPTGVRPKFVEKLEKAGIQLPSRIFTGLGRAFV